MSRAVKLKTGWLDEDLDRATRRFKEWSARPITKAQNARVQEKQSATRTVTDATETGKRKSERS